MFGSVSSRGSRISTASTSWPPASWSSGRASRAGRGSRRRRRRASAAARAGRRARARLRRRRAASLEHGLAPERERAGPSMPCPALPGGIDCDCAVAEGDERRAGCRGALARWPRASATPSATSAFRRSAVPNDIEAETSSASQVTSTRSARSTRTWVSPVRAVTFHSIRRTSSPGRYGRTWASSLPAPSSEERWSPESMPFDSPPDRQVERAEQRPGSGPGPGRSACGRTRSSRERSSSRARPLAQVELRREHLRDHGVEDRVRVDLLGERLVAEHQPVAERVLRERLDVLAMT